MVRLGEALHRILNVVYCFGQGGGLDQRWYPGDRI